MNIQWIYIWVLDKATISELCCPNWPIGVPSFSQVMLGTGNPEAWHDKVTCEPRVWFRDSQGEPSRTGGTVEMFRYQGGTSAERGLEWNTVKGEKDSRVVSLPWTVSLNVLSTCPATLETLQVYVPSSATWGPKINSWHWEFDLGQKSVSIPSLIQFN